MVFVDAAAHQSPGRVARGAVRRVRGGTRRRRARRDPARVVPIPDANLGRTTRVRTARAVGSMRDGARRSEGRSEGTPRRGRRPGDPRRAVRVHRALRRKIVVARRYESVRWMKKSAVLFSRVDVVSRALARASRRASRASSFIYTLTLHPNAPDAPPRFSSTMRVTRSHQNAYPAARRSDAGRAKSARLGARADSLSMPEVVLSQTMCLNPPRV